MVLIVGLHVARRNDRARARPTIRTSAPRQNIKDLEMVFSNVRAADERDKYSYGKSKAAQDTQRRGKQ